MPQPSRPSPAFRQAARWLLREHAWLPATLLVMVIAVVPVAIAATTLAAHEREAASARHGTTIVDRLAASALDSLLADDPIALAVLVREFKALPDVTTAAVYGADDRLLAAADGRATSPATLIRETRPPVHVRPIRIEDAIAGYARVEVDPLGIRAATGLLAATITAACFALLLLAAWLNRRLEGLLVRPRERLEELTGTQSDAHSSLAALLDLTTEEVAEEAADPALAHVPSPEHHCYVMVVNLFNQASLPPATRQEMFIECEDVLAKVCRLYGGRAERLPRTGVLVTFDALSEQGDHAFQAICAALLAQRVFVELNAERAAAGKAELLLRIGLDRVIDEELGQLGDDGSVISAYPDSIARGITLSALARDEGVAISDTVLGACSHPERLQREALQSAALRALGGSGQAWLVADLAPGYRDLINQQAQRLLE